MCRKKVTTLRSIDTRRKAIIIPEHHTLSPSLPRGVLEVSFSCFNTGGGAGTVVVQPLMKGQRTSLNSCFCNYLRPDVRQVLARLCYRSDLELGPEHGGRHKNTQDRNQKPTQSAQKDRGLGVVEVAETEDAQPLFHHVEQTAKGCCSDTRQMVGIMAGSTLELRLKARGIVNRTLLILRPTNRFLNQM